MKTKGFLTMALAVCLTALGVAQEQTREQKEWNPEKRATHKVERFSKTTEVPIDKQEKLIQVLTATQEKRKAMREQENVTKEERIALREEHREKVKEVLETEELIQAWREFNEAERQKRRNSMKHKHAKSTENHRLKERQEKE
jgi:hypothetical protein